MAKKKNAPPNGLTDQQWAFVQEYLVDRNGKQAAIRAGYSAKTAEVQASRLLSLDKVRVVVKEGLRMLAERTETEAEYVRRRLKEEADNFSYIATHSGRIRALELLGKINGVFELDNKQKTDPLRDLLGALSGNVLGVSKAADDDED